MNAERFETLLAEFFDGQLTPEQHREFLDAAAENPQWGHRLIELLRFEPLMADYIRNDFEGEGFLRRMQQRLEKAGDSARFAKAIVDELRQRRSRHPGKTSVRMNAVPMPAGKTSARLTAVHLPSGKSSARMAAVSDPGSSARMRSASRSSIRIRTLRGNRSQGYGLTLSAVAAVLLLAAGFLFRAVLQPGPGAVATLSSVKGNVSIVSGASRKAAASGAAIPSGSGIETEGSGEAVIAYPDGTTLELQAQSVISELADGLDSSAGKTIHLTRGSLKADVAKQPLNRPMLITTATARIRVIGTRFILEGKAEATRLQVTEGLVELTRKSDQKSVQVGTGEFVLAPEKGDLAVRTVTPTTSEPAVAEGDSVFTTASFLGGGGGDSIIAAEMQSDGTVVFGANISNLKTRGRTTLLNGSSETAAGAVIRVSSTGRAVLSITRVDAAVNDLSIDANDNIYVATKSTGALKLNPAATEVIWKGAIAGECRRVDASSDGMVAALFKDQVCVIGADGVEIGEFSGRSQVADIAISSVSKTVFAAGNLRSEGKKGQASSAAYLSAYKFDGTPIWSDYGTATTELASTQACRVAMGRDGKLYASFVAYGKNNVFLFGPHGLQSTVPLMEYDEKSKLHDTIKTPITFFGRFDLASGDLMLGQFVLGRDAAGQGTSVSAIEGDIKADENGRVYLAGVASSGGPLTGNAVGAREFSGKDGFLYIDNPEQRRRELFTYFSAGNEGVTAMQAVAARVLAGRTEASVVVAGKVVSAEPSVFIRQAVQPVSGGETDGYFAIRNVLPPKPVDAR